MLDNKNNVQYIPPEARDYETPEITFAILGYLAEVGVENLTVECYIGESNMPSARITQHFQNGNSHDSYPYHMPDLPKDITETLQRKFI